MSDPASLGRWLDQRLEGVEPELATLLGASVSAADRELRLEHGPDALGAVASRRLQLLLERGCGTRDAAPELLTVDALVTYACELAAEVATDPADTALRVLRQVCVAVERVNG